MSDVDTRTAPPIDDIDVGRTWTRHPVLAVFVVALVVRLAFSVALLASGHWPVAPDERQYVELASVIASGQPASAWDPAWGDDLFSQTATFLLPVSWLFRLFGVHAFLGMLVACLAGATAAALTARLTIAAGRRSWALAAGGVIALLPSQVLWSSLVLRESAIWAALAAIALLLTIALRTTGLRTLGLIGAGMVASMWCLFHLRPYVFVVACWAVVGAALLGAPARRLLTPASAVAVAIALPALCGIGVGGITLVSTNLPFLDKIQAALAVGADSAIVKPAPTAGSPRPRPVDGGGGAESAAGPRHIVRGIIAVTLRPFLWERPTGIGAVLAQLENLAWIVLYGLAAIGVWARRRERQVLAFPVIFTLGFVVMSALFEGNVGTAFRHRGQIAWALLLLAVLGAEALLARRAEQAASVEL